MSTEGTHRQEAERKRLSEETANPRAMAPVETAVALPTALLDDLRSLIEDARGRVAAAVNVETVLLNWHLGQRIWREILGEARADYGKQIVDALSRQLIAEYGRGFGRDNLFHMVRFARTVRGTLETVCPGSNRSGHQEARKRDHRDASRGHGVRAQLESTRQHLRRIRAFSGSKSHYYNVARASIPQYKNRTGSRGWLR